jgi:hypothetical protein
VIFPLLLDFNAYPMKEIHRQVGASFQSAGIPYIDLLANFSQIPIWHCGLTRMMIRTRMQPAMRLPQGNSAIVEEQLIRQ